MNSNNQVEVKLSCGWVGVLMIKVLPLEGSGGHFLLTISGKKFEPKFRRWGSN